MTPTDERKMRRLFAIKSGWGELSDAREAAGLSTGQAVKVLGLSRDRLRELEAGADASPDERKALCDAYDVTGWVPRPALADALAAIGDAITIDDAQERLLTADLLPADWLSPDPRGWLCLVCNGESALLRGPHCRTCGAKGYLPVPSSIGDMLALCSVGVHNLLRAEELARAIPHVIRARWHGDFLAPTRVVWATSVWSKVFDDRPRECWSTWNSMGYARLLSNGDWQWANNIGLTTARPNGPDDVCAPLVELRRMGFHLYRVTPTAVQLVVPDLLVHS